MLTYTVGTPVIKVSRTESYGATVIITGNNYDEAFDACKQAVDEAKGTLVHPFDDPFVIAGTRLQQPVVKAYFYSTTFPRPRYHWT
jgi:threonine dehydratase